MKAIFFKKKNIIFIVLTCFFTTSQILTISSCADENGSAVEIFAGEGSGMILVKSKGEKITLGTDITTAPLAARPAMTVKFTYDYSLSKREVTQGEYADLTGGVIDSSLKNFPQANVTYYDAVLYANLRSKAEGIDSVYTYKSISRNTNGQCIQIEGLVTHLDRDGYRLPTEAEWTYAASLGWNPSGKAWTSDNSGYVAHEVCAAGVDGAGFCDLAGNLLEWSEDWLGSFKDTTMTDFAGAPDGGSIGERVVKGGSYRNAAANMNLYLRGDVYTVTSSTHAGYVGFRLARGPIKSPTWISSAGATSSKISVMSTASTIKRIFGTSRVKLAFRDDETGDLAYIDWSSGIASVKRIADTLDVYHPEISPNGEWVAFSTKPEGISGTSALYARCLDSTGFGLVKLNVKSAAIPRWYAKGLDTAIIYVTDAGDNTNSADWKKVSTWKVPFANGKFRTPVKLYDGTFNAGISYDEKLLVTGSKLLRAKVNQKDTLWYNGEQACNASLSRDSGKKTLFLDFGGETGQAFAGTPYEAHGRLLVADSLGKLIATYPAPSGYTFDHTEWAIGDTKDMAVATLVNTSGAHSQIISINLADSAITELAEGDELWHPNLWVASKTLTVDSMNFDLDSLAAYDAGTADYHIKGFRYKMEMLWRDVDLASILITGSSRPWAGINPLLLTSGYAINMSSSINDIDVSDSIIKNYILPHWNMIKYIVISLDIDILYHGEDWWNEYYNEVPGFKYDAEHDYWPTLSSSVLYQASLNAWGKNRSTRSEIYKNRGFYSNIDSSWGGSVPEILQDSTRADGIGLDSLYLDKIKGIIKMAADHDIYVIGVIFPMSPEYKKTGSFGRYGLRRSLAEKIIQKIKTYEGVYSNFRLMDENKMGNHDYTEDMAADYDHLNVNGAKQLTERLDSLLKILK